MNEFIARYVHVLLHARLDTIRKMEHQGCLLLSAALADGQYKKNERPRSIDKSVSSVRCSLPAAQPEQGRPQPRHPSINTQPVVRRVAPALQRSIVRTNVIWLGSNAEGHRGRGGNFRNSFDLPAMRNPYGRFRCIQITTRFSNRFKRLRSKPLPPPHL